MSSYNTGRVKHAVQTTIDRTVDFDAEIGVSGSATALSGNLIFATERHCTVSGTSPGRVYLAFPYGYEPGARLIAWGATFTAGSTSSLNFGGPGGIATSPPVKYAVNPLSYVYPYGSFLASSSIGLYSNPKTQTDPRAVGYDGGGYFTLDIQKLQTMVTGNVAAGNVSALSGTNVDPVDASVASGWPTMKINVWAKFRMRGRDGF